MNRFVSGHDCRALARVFAKESGHAQDDRHRMLGTREHQRCHTMSIKISSVAQTTPVAAEAITAAHQSLWRKRSPSTIDTANASIEIPALTAIRVSQLSS